MTLIAVAGLALATGGCSLRSPTGSSTYSSLQPDVTAASVATPEAARVAALPPDFEEVPARMPGDPTRSIPEGGAAHVNPLSALSESARARDHWEKLKPGTAKAHVPVIGAASSTGSLGEPNTPAAASAQAPASGANYDREAAMQNLIKGGKIAASPICNGC
ncbi:hypothetical protein [Methylobacterium sp. J-067]|uniref:hypothetical protein n=1 Tax=Methylobacterium sp. J-067 TaxID=2836648 RepID=UPI001FBB3B15|nr:hypothetical protein [Methylobacterium sp. J-067]MCJ2022721.1 hypothetical protein [Methylobacterium sp. J-067]